MCPSASGKDPEFTPDWIIARNRQEQWWLGIQRDLLNTVDPVPSHEELRARAKDLGLTLCTCRSIDRGDGQTVTIYDPNCPIPYRYHQRA